MLALQRTGSQHWRLFRRNRPRRQLVRPQELLHSVEQLLAGAEQQASPEPQEVLAAGAQATSLQTGLRTMRVQVTVSQYGTQTRTVRVDLQATLRVS